MDVPVPRSFDGANIKSWLNTVKRYAQWKDVDAYMLLLTYLEDGDIDVLRNLVSTNSVSAFVDGEYLQRVYGDNTASVDEWEEFVSCVQKKDESVFDFGTNLVKRASKSLGLEDSEDFQAVVKFKFIFGLYDKEIIKKLVHEKVNMGTSMLDLIRVCDSLKSDSRCVTAVRSIGTGSQEDVKPESLMFHCTVNRKQLRYQIDTGSSISLISHNAFTELKMAHEPLESPIKLSGAFGHTVTVKGRCLVQFTFDDLRYSGYLYITEKLSLPMLIGRDILYHQNNKGYFLEKIALVKAHADPNSYIKAAMEGSTKVLSVLNVKTSCELDLIDKLVLEQQKLNLDSMISEVVTSLEGVSAAGLKDLKPTKFVKHEIKVSSSVPLRSKVRKKVIGSVVEETISGTAKVVGSVGDRGALNSKLVGVSTSARPGA